jgi:DNA primase
MQQGTIREIKDTVDIVDIVGEFVDLKRTGQNYRGFCPVHAETKPSFTVSPKKQIAKCFGCGFSTDAIGFLMEVENLSYVQALKFIAEYYGIETEEDKEKYEIYKTNARLAKYFQKKLFQAPKLLKYLKSRELSKETVKEFKLGYAPKENYIRKLNIKNANQAGLIYQGNPRLYNRIVFPIFNSNGKIIGFNGRRLPNREKGAKYLNIPNTKVYNKSKVLYNLYRAKDFIRKKGYSILVEGNMDVISLYDNGIREILGSCGTAVTNDQVKKIRRYCDKIFLLLDSDEAGKQATLKAGFTCLKNNLYVKVIPLPEGKDPDDFFNSKEMFNEYVKENKKKFLDYFFSQKDISEIKDKADVIEELKNQFEGAKTVKEELIINEISDRLNVSKDTLRDEILTVKTQPKSNPTSVYKIEMTIAKKAIENEKLRQKVWNKTKPKMFQNRTARKVLKLLRQHKSGDIYIFLDAKINKKHMQFLKRESNLEFHNCLDFVISRYKDKKLKKLKKKMEQTNDKQKKKELLLKIKELRR